MASLRVEHQREELAQWPARSTRAAPTARRRASRAARRAAPARARRGAGCRPGLRPAPLPSRARRRELFDLAEDGAAVAVRRLVGAHGVELGATSPRAVRRPATPTARRSRGSAAPRWPARLGRRCRWRSRCRCRGRAVPAPGSTTPERARTRAAPGAASAAGGAGAAGAGPGAGAGAGVGVRAASSRFTRLRTFGSPNASATWPVLRTVVTWRPICSWRRSTSARPRATNVSTTLGAASSTYRPAPSGANNTTSMARSMARG